ncbi:MAG TPA: HupE/UreJ family protein [Chitinophagaceae bacterium]|nr:HupE/UreJ family protein [Chitinophagaceae bacterium]
MKRSSPQPLKKLLCIGLLLLAAGPLWAHTVNYVLEKAPVTEVASFYLKLGFEHIIPEGLDHILFVVALCLLGRNLKTILWQATAFTVAHSITLALSLQNIITLPGNLVEPIIALSIVFVAVENLLLTELKPWRLGIVFLFGLIHGLGFASALNETGLPRNAFFTSLLSFNVGVELGQAAVIAVVYGLLVYPFRNQVRYRKALVYPLSGLIALVAMYWAVERMVQV